MEQPRSSSRQLKFGGYCVSTWQTQSGLKTLRWSSETLWLVSMLWFRATYSGRAFILKLWIKTSSCLCFYALKNHTGHQVVLSFVGPSWLPRCVELGSNKHTWHLVLVGCSLHIRCCSFQNQRLLKNSDLCCLQSWPSWEVCASQNQPRCSHAHQLKWNDNIAVQAPFLIKKINKIINHTLCTHPC